MSSGCSVLVVGDVMLDERFEGEMTRISPEAPTPVVRAARPTYKLGGAGNVAANIAALGHKTYLLSVTGPDSQGQMVQQLCNESGLYANLYHGVSRTTTKTRVTCQGQQVFRYDQEEQLLTFDGVRSRYLQSAIAAVLPDVGIIVVADYNKGVIDGPLMDQLVSSGKSVYVDGKGNPHFYRGVTLLKPNLKEAMAYVATHIHPVLETPDMSDRAIYIGQVLFSDFGIQSVCITLGPAGAVYVKTGGEVCGRPYWFQSSLPPQQCFDVTGAGDTFMAGLVDAYLLGLPMDQAVLRANTAAARAVSQHGTYVITRAALEDAILARLGPPGKIMTDAALQQYLLRKRQSGRVVFTNGTFRVLHQGHIELLKFAKAQGDCLIVGINSDSSLQVLKPGKRFVPEGYRAALLSQMPYVDAVVIFDEVDATDVVRRVSPHVLVKGAEYIEQRVAGADFVARHGGEVLFAPMVGDIHASDLSE